MKELTTIGIDIAKSVFQIHGIDSNEKVVCRRKLARRDFLLLFSKVSPCLIGMEDCASAHHWARELGKLGHEVRLMPAALKTDSRNTTRQKTPSKTRYFQLKTGPKNRTKSVLALEKSLEKN